MELAVEIAGLQPETLKLTTEWVQHAEKLGCSMAFAAEAWWSDAATPLAYLADKTEKIKLATGIMPCFVTRACLWVCCACILPAYCLLALMTDALF